MVWLVLTTDAGEPLDIDPDGVIRGGEACVYPGTDPSGSAVAVKVANHPLPDGAWLIDEADTLERLAGAPSVAAHVVRPRGHGTWAGRPFLVIPWYPETLEQRVRTAELADRLALAARLCDAVAALHALDPPVVHRDLKPSNVLLDGDRPVLADFGLARAARADATVHTAVPHTPGFSAPELHGPGPHRPTLGQDRYALAATVLFALTGRSPAAGGLALLRDRIHGPALVDALGAMLSADPDARTVAAAELGAAVRAARPAATRMRRPWMAPAAMAAIALVTVPLALRGESDPQADAPVAPSDYPTTRIEVGGHPLEVGVTEVSQGLWDALGGDPLARRREYRDGNLGPTCTRHYMLPLIGDDLPMVCVDFADAADAANRMSRAWGLAPVYLVSQPAGSARAEVTWDRAADGWRLPTRDEWRTLARRAFPTAPDADPGACARINVGDAALVRFFPTFATQSRPVPCDDGHAALAPVASLAPDALGLHHLWGNVHEWAWDQDGQGTRAVMGASFVGSVGEDPRDRRGALPAVDRRTSLGFRLVRDAP